MRQSKEWSSKAPESILIRVSNKDDAVRGKVESASLVACKTWSNHLVKVHRYMVAEQDNAMKGEEIYKCDIKNCNKYYDSNILL